MITGSRVIEVPVQNTKGRYQGRHMLEIKVRDVQSSNVEWVGWPADGTPLMVVQFQGGTRYGYIGASRQRVVAAAHSPSVGKYINSRVKPTYPVVRLLS